MVILCDLIFLSVFHLHVSHFVDRMKINSYYSVQLMMAWGKDGQIREVDVIQALNV